MSGLESHGIVENYQLGGPRVTFYPLPAGPIIAIALVGLFVITIVFFVGTALSSSGRGLDTDEWEVNHSAWMQQLYEDFEDSWKEQ